MKVIIAIVAGFISSTGYASTKSFDVKAALSIGGKLISKSHIITKPSELASISQKDENSRETVFEVIATDSSEATKEGIMMKFSVSYNYRGKRTVISKLQIVAIPGEEAQISVGQVGKNESVNINVIATRVE